MDDNNNQQNNPAETDQSQAEGGVQVAEATPAQSPEASPGTPELSGPSLMSELFTNKKMLIPVVVIALALVFIIISRMMSTPQELEEEIPLEVATTDDMSLADQIAFAPAAIAAYDYTAGTTFIVDSVTLPEPGFVVVYDEGTEEAGEVIGVSEYLPGGNSGNVEIQLTRATVSGERIFVMLTIDDGDLEFSDADEIYTDIGFPFVAIFTIE